MKTLYYVSILNFVVVVVIHITSLFLDDMSMFLPYIGIFFFTTLGLAIYGGNIKNNKGSSKSIGDIPSYVPVILILVALYVAVMLFLTIANFGMGQLLEQDGVYKFKTGNEIRILSREEYHLKLTWFISFVSTACIGVAGVAVLMFYNKK